MEKAIIAQRKKANDEIIAAYKNGASISQIASMRLKQNTIEKAQFNLFGIK